MMSNSVSYLFQRQTKIYFSALSEFKKNDALIFHLNKRNLKKHTEISSPKITICIIFFPLLPDLIDFA